MCSALFRRTADSPAVFIFHDLRSRDFEEKIEGLWTGYLLELWQRRRLQKQERQKSHPLLSKTTTLLVHHAFLYISLPSLHYYDAKMPNFTFYGGRIKTSHDEIFFRLFPGLFLNLNAVPKLRNPLQRVPPTFSANWYNRDKVFSIFRAAKTENPVPCRSSVFLYSYLTKKLSGTYCRKKPHES